MATTPRRSKPTFAFTTTPSTEDAQYARVEMERLTEFLLAQLEDLRLVVNGISASPATDFSAQIAALSNNVNLLAAAISHIPIVDISNFLTPEDLQPIVVNNNFTRTITIAFDQIAVFFDGTNNNGDITNNGLLLVL